MSGEHTKLLRSLKVSLPGAGWNYHVSAYWDWHDFRIGTAYLTSFHTWQIYFLFLTIEVEQA